MYEELANAKILVDANALIAAFVHSGLLDKAKCGEILELIKRCSAIQKNWIPVSERLPEDRRAVLVTAYWHETYQVMMASYYGNGLWWCVPFNNCGEHMQRLNPKAWMPLPEPYKESEGK